MEAVNAAKGVLQGRNLSVSPGCWLGKNRRQVWRNVPFLSWSSPRPGGRENQYGGLELYRAQCDVATRTLLRRHETDLQSNEFGTQIPDV